MESRKTKKSLKT